MWNLTIRIKQLLPKAKTVSCGDNAFPFRASNSRPCAKGGACMNMSELEPGGILEFIDILIPRMATYANQTAQHLAAVLRKGKQIGWYTSGIPGGSYALTLAYLEYSPMRPRLLIGTAAFKLGAEAYLYHSLAGWTAYKQGLLACRGTPRR